MSLFPFGLIHSRDYQTLQNYSALLGATRARNEEAVDSFSALTRAENSLKFPEPASPVRSLVVGNEGRETGLTHQLECEALTCRNNSSSLAVVWLASFDLIDRGCMPTSDALGQLGFPLCYSSKLRRPLCGHCIRFEADLSQSAVHRRGSTI
jgi:hypothetical protein